MSGTLLSIKHIFSSLNNEEAYVHECTHLSQRSITLNSLEQCTHTRPRGLRGGEDKSRLEMSHITRIFHNLQTISHMTNPNLTYRLN